MTHAAARAYLEGALDAQCEGRRAVRQAYRCIIKIAADGDRCACEIDNGKLEDSASGAAPGCRSSDWLQVPAGRWLRRDHRRRRAHHFFVNRPGL